MTSNYTKLPPEDKEAWVKALRGGDFSQARSILYDHREGSFCCLGVKLKLMGHVPGLAGGKCFPSVKGWVSTISVDDSAISVLIRMNDRGSTFDQIADWIEKNL